MHVFQTSLPTGGVLRCSSAQLEDPSENQPTIQGRGGPFCQLCLAAETLVSKMKSQAASHILRTLLAADELQVYGLLRWELSEGAP